MNFQDSADPAPHHDLMVHVQHITALLQMTQTAPDIQRAAHPFSIRGHGHATYEYPPKTTSGRSSTRSDRLRQMSGPIPAGSPPVIYKGSIEELLN